MSDALDRLAAAAGISAEYHDYFGVHRLVSSDTKLALLAAMDFDVSNDDAIEASLHAFQERTWRSRLEPVIVSPESAPLTIVFAHLAARAGDVHEWRIALEDGSQAAGSIVPAELPFHEARDIDGALLERRSFSITQALPLGYHTASVSDGETLSTTTIAIVPAACYLPAQLERQRAWGLSAQLYALRSRRNWGIGDFGDLAVLSRIVADAGGSLVGLNPLHELNPRDAGAASPYSPSSRLLLNPIYIDPQALPGYEPGDADEAELVRLRSATLVDYTGVTRTKRAAFEAAFRRFRKRERGTKAARAFRAFVRAGGETLRRGAIFDALTEHFAREAPERWGWRSWPAPYTDPASPAVAAFAREHAAEVDFFCYLQWQADVQLAAAAAEWPREALGLYRDLAVGADAQGADTWAGRDTLASPVTLGAPPDPLNAEGQNWGVAPFSPSRLRDSAYAPFAELLRANMRHAGVLRIDHVMALMRLFWIPAGAPISEGAYVRYPFEEMLGIIVLESARAQCVVIGEDLGNIPEGLRERLAAARVLSCRLLYFERDGVRFRTPAEYPPLAMVAIGTHDLPPFAGWWNGSDIETRAALPWGGEAEAARERDERATDRDALLAAFQEAGATTAEEAERLRAAPTQPPEARDMAEGARCANRFLAETPGRLLLVQIEDVAGSSEQVNVPGTVDQHPNWRRKITLDLEDFAADPRWISMAEDVQRART